MTTAARSASSILRRITPSSLTRWKRAWLAVVTLALGSVASAQSDTAAANRLEMQRLLRQLREVGSVLYVAAHPDDENTEFITYFARGRAYRTAYLSLTRGDGGQNELGPDFGEKLGLLRTQELLAARRLDGGQQFFTRAIDFGFSKTPEETLRFWNHDTVLSDVVRVIRQFQPDVIVTRFPVPPGSGGHGHHTASAILAVEAFKLAGDSHAFPDQLTEGLKPWQPKRILWNVFSWGRTTDVLPGPTVTLDLGGNDPLTGEAFGTIANQSRGMHKTQGLGVLASRTSTGPNVQTFRLLAGEAPEHDLFDGIDLTWSRLPGGAAIGSALAALAEHFDPEKPVASIPAILALRPQLAALPESALVTAKRTQLDRLLQLCLGLSVEATVANAAVTPGVPFKLKETVTLASDYPVKWTGAVAHGLRNDRGEEFSLRSSGTPLELKPGTPTSGEPTVQLPANAVVSQPYWLREDPDPGIYTVSDARLIGRPLNPPDFVAEEHFEIGGQVFVVSTDVVQAPADAATNSARAPLRVVAPVSLAWSQPLAVLAPGATQPLALEITAQHAKADGTIEVTASDGWKITPAQQPFHLSTIGEKATLSFIVTALADAGSGQLAVKAHVGAGVFDRGLVELRYDHLAPQFLAPRAEIKLVACEVAIHAKRLGYIPGAGDDIAGSLRLLGCEVTELNSADALTPDSLRRFDAIVLGVRAFNENQLLAPALPGLLAYVEAGGTVVAQYNRPNSALKDRPLGPYPLSIDGPAPQLRVTDETAPVTFLAPDHPALNSPNKITAADFTGWVQERGAYFPSSWDEAHYTALLAMNDPGEAPLRSSLLVARHGQGWFVYTGLSFFRQLPAGNPGAYRLFANLVSLGR